MNTGTVVSVGSSSSILPRNRTERMAPEIPIRNERNITRIMFISSISVILFFYFLMKILYQKNLGSVNHTVSTPSIFIFPSQCHSSPTPSIHLSSSKALPRLIAKLSASSLLSKYPSMILSTTALI